LLHDLQRDIFAEKRETVCFFVDDTTITGRRDRIGGKQRRQSSAGNCHRWFSRALSRRRRWNEAIIEGDAAVVLHRRLKLSDAGGEDEVVEAIKRNKKRFVCRRRSRRGREWPDGEWIGYGTVTVQIIVTNLYRIMGNTPIEVVDA